MKRIVKIAVLALVAVVGSALLGGSLWWWLAGVVMGRFVIRLLLTVALAILIYCLIYAIIIGSILWILIS